MIIKSSQRGRGVQLARHLTKETDDDGIQQTVIVSGSRNILVTNNVHEALDDMEKMAWASPQTKKHLYHVSINPDQELTPEQWHHAWSEYEQEYGLQDHAYTEVTHIKKGRAHVHRVYERVDTSGKAIKLSYTKIRNEKVARILEHNFNHDLTIGKHNRAVIRKLREEGKSDIANWMERGKADEIERPAAEMDYRDIQQQRRTKISKKEVKEILQTAYAATENGKDFEQAITAHDLYLAKGDRRDFVIVDATGSTHSPRRLIGVKAKDLRKQWSDLDANHLSTVDEIKSKIDLRRLPKTDTSDKDRTIEILQAEAEETDKLIAELQRQLAEQRLANQEQTRESEKLIAADEESLDSAQLQEIASHSGDMAQKNYRKPKHDRTRTAIERQLKGMHADEFEIGIRNQQTGKMFNRPWKAEKILEPETLGWLKRQNLNGHDIYIRPAGSTGLVLVDDLDRLQLKKMEEDGLKPAVVTQTSDANYQAWVRVSEQPIPKETATQVAKILAERYGGDPNSADWRHYGRLAGFTNRKPEHIQKNGKSPFVLMESYHGKSAPEASELLREAQKRVEAAKVPEVSQGTSQRITVPTNAPSEAATQARDWFEQNWQHYRAEFGPDESRVDWHMCKAIAKAGHEPETVAYALRHGSPNLDERKKGHIDDYVSRTTGKVMELEEVVRARDKMRSHSEQADQRELIEQWQEYRGDDQERGKPQEQSEWTEAKSWGIDNTTLEVMQTYAGPQAEAERNRRIDSATRAAEAPQPPQKSALSEYLTSLGQRLKEKGRDYYRRADRWLTERLARLGYSRAQARRVLAQASPELMDRQPGRRVSYIRRIVERVYRKREQSAQPPKTKQTHNGRDDLSAPSMTQSQDNSASNRSRPRNISSKVIYKRSSEQL